MAAVSGRRTPGREAVPAVQRLRLRYAKRGRLRFASHRDFQRALERALRRAQVPMAYSAGFSPHPRVSYANAAPTGAASEAEYVELAVVHRCRPDRVRTALDAALPVGLDVVDVVEARTPDLAARLQASRWRIELPGVGQQDVGDAVAGLLAADRVEVQRLTKAGVRTFDARGPLVVVDVEPGTAGAACAILDLVVRHTTPAVRPDDVIAALRAVADLVPPVPPRVTRLAQGPLEDGSTTVGDPLAPDRDMSP